MLLPRAGAVLAMLAVVSAAHAQRVVDDPANWVQTTSGCSVRVSFAPAGTRVTWTGGCTDGRTSGEGVLVATSGSTEERYEGSMNGGKPDGVGTAYYANGQTIHGTFREGVVEGEVIYTLPGHYRYEGGWLAGREEGNGAADFTDGTRYAGGWHKGVQSGHGVKTFVNGGKFEGEFLDGRMNGAGVLISPGGARLEGIWHNDRLDGHASFANPRGDHFDGEYVDGQRNGPGTYVWANGDRYDGGWKSNVPDGEGTLTYQQGAFSGSWRQGCLRTGDHFVAAFVDLASCKR